jgi:hypothetical protein
MSLTAIARAFGIGRRTIIRDLQEVGDTAPSKVMGVDGRVYVLDHCQRNGRYKRARSLRDGA